MNLSPFATPRPTPLPLLALLLAIPLCGHGQQPVLTPPTYPTNLNPALAVPAGTPVPDGAKLPAVPIPAPPATLPAPVATIPGTIVAATPLSPGQFDAAMLAWPGGVNPAYRAARTPLVNVAATLAALLPAAAPDGLSLPAVAPLAPIARQGGRFESVGLLLADNGAGVLPAALALNFGAAAAGKKVWVQPVDGGTLDGQPGGRFVTLGVGGTLAAVFQPPAETGLYHVLVRLEDIQSALPFWVLRARDLNGPASPAELVLPVVGGL